MLIKLITVVVLLRFLSLMTFLLFYCLNKGINYLELMVDIVVLI
jgi:hypothetical protein